MIMITLYIYYLYNFISNVYMCIIKINYKLLYVKVIYAEDDAEEGQV